MNALLLVLLLPAAELRLQENFAENPSFELDRNRDGQPDGWHGSAYLAGPGTPPRRSWNASEG